MPEEPRESRGQEAGREDSHLARTALRPAFGPRFPDLSPPLLAFAFRPGPPGAPRPGNEGRRGAARGAARTTWDTYLPLRRYTINERGGGPAPGKVLGWGGRPRGPTAERGRRARGRGGRPAGTRRRGGGGATGLPCRDLDLLGWAKPSAAEAQDHVWFCVVFSPPEGEGLPQEEGGFFFFLFPSTRRENEAETR